MVALAGYKNLILIHDSENSQVYRARRISDARPVIIKFLNREYPSLEQIRRYKQEYQLIKQLDSPGIVKAYSLEEWHRSLAMVLEDFGAISLKQLLQQGSRVSLEEFLGLAIAITESFRKMSATIRRTMCASSLENRRFLMILHWWPCSNDKLFNI